MRYTVIFLTFICLFVTPAPAAPANLPSDDWLEGRIQGALDFNSYFDSSEVEVRVENRVATLSGKVPTEIERDFAEDIASRMEGIERVDNRLVIDENLPSQNRSELEQYIADASITAKVRTKLDASKLTFNSRIDVDTNNGVVFLGGSAISDEAKEHAQQLAERTQGVNQVKNRIIIEDPAGVGDKVENAVVDLKKTVSDAWISAKIRSQLLFSTDYPGSRIKVDTKEGRVRLTGYVRNYQQKDRLSDDVNHIRGVKAVVNEVSVTEKPEALITVPSAQ